MSPASDDDQVGWLLTFSDLVLQLFAFVLVAFVLGGTNRVAPATASAVLAVPASTPERPLRTGESHEAPRIAAARKVTTARAPSARFIWWDGAAAGTEARGAGETVPSEADATASRDAVVADAAGRDFPSALRAGGDSAIAQAPAEDRNTEIAAIGRRLADFVDATGLGDEVSVSIGISDVVVILNGAVGFDSGSDDVPPQAESLIREVRALASSFPNLAVEVAGFTDDVPIHTPRFPSNLELSLARAARVAHALGAGDSGLPVRTATMGFGEHHAVASNGDANGRARNRRVELRLLAAAHSMP